MLILNMILLTTSYVYVMSILSNSRFYKINIQNVDFVKSTCLFDKIDILNVYFVKST